MLQNLLNSIKGLLDLGKGGGSEGRVTICLRWKMFTPDDHRKARVWLLVEPGGDGGVEGGCQLQSVALKHSGRVCL